MAVTMNRDEREGQKTSYVWNRKKSPTKKRGLKISHNPFIPLLGGKESPELTELRWTKFNEHWKMTRNYIKQRIDLETSHVLEGIVSFMREQWDNDSDARLPTAIVLSGPDTANHMALCSEIYKKLDTMDAVKLVVLSSKNCPNLKVALKTIVAHITEGRPGTVLQEEDEEEAGDELFFDRRLRYDLGILAEWCRLQESKQDRPAVENHQIVVAVADTDSFDVSILTGLIHMLHLYISQIPFKIILSVSTSLSVFENKLPRSLLRLLKGKEFVGEIEDSVEALIPTSSDIYVSHFLGPKIIGFLRERQKQSIKSTGAVESTLKYALMAHFFSNPFAIFVDGWHSSDASRLTAEHFHAARMLPSFRKHVEQLIRSKNSESAEYIDHLLSDDTAFKNFMENAIIDLRRYLLEMTDLVNLISAIYAEQDHDSLARLDIYQKCMMGTFEFDIDGLVPDDEELQRLMQNNCMHLSCLPDDVTKEKLINMISTSFFKDGFMGKPFHEFFIYDNVALLETVFSPTLRPAIELGLSDSSHYWGGNQAVPHICTLYQMCRESSVYINIFDCFTAFKESLGSSNEKEVLAWFLNGIAELKKMGVVRDCKRKFECIEKVAWKGL